MSSVMVIYSFDENVVTSMPDGPSDASISITLLLFVFIGGIISDESSDSMSIMRFFVALGGGGDALLRLKKKKHEKYER